MLSSPSRQDADDESRPRRAPAGSGRREALLEKAAEVFLEHGYHGATIDRIIGRAGGSKATLYKNFGGKEGLFLAIMERLGRDVFDAFEPVRWRGRTLSGIREDIGEAYLEQAVSDRAIRLWRLCVAEAGRSPALARAAFERGPAAAVSRLAAIFETLQAEGRLTTLNAHGAAQAYLALLRRDDVLLGPMMGLSFQRPPDWRRRLAQESAALFLKGVEEAR